VTDCFVCRKHRGELVMPGGVLYEDELVYATHMALPDGQERVALGTLFVEPRRHVPGMGDLSRAEAERVGWLTSRLAAALQASERAEHVYVFVLGHHVRHLHVWVVPRHPGTPAEFAPFQLAAWPDAPRGGAAEIAALCDRVRAELARGQSST
jgi:histidine triad (HIT) family protein